MGDEGQLSRDLEHVLTLNEFVLILATGARVATRGYALIAVGLLIFFLSRQGVKFHQVRAIHSRSVKDRSVFK
jgi:hypothetical protein